jgi:hypothetical protein
MAAKTYHPLLVTDGRCKKTLRLLHNYRSFQGWQQPGRSAEWNGMDCGKLASILLNQGQPAVCPFACLPVCPFARAERGVLVWAGTAGAHAGKTCRPERWVVVSRDSAAAGQTGQAAAAVLEADGCHLTPLQRAGAALLPSPDLHTPSRSTAPPHSAKLFFHGPVLPRAPALVPETSAAAQCLASCIPHPFVLHPPPRTYFCPRLGDGWHDGAALQQCSSPAAHQPTTTRTVRQPPANHLPSDAKRSPQKINPVAGCPRRLHPARSLSPLSPDQAIGMPS